MFVCMCARVYLQECGLCGVRMFCVWVMWIVCVLCGLCVLCVVYVAILTQAMAISLCPICLEPLGDAFQDPWPCEHGIHASCLDRNHETALRPCPLCREPSKMGHGLAPLQVEGASAPALPPHMLVPMCCRRIDHVGDRFIATDDRRMVWSPHVYRNGSAVPMFVCYSCGKDFNMFQGIESQDLADLISWRPPPCRFHGEPCLVLDTVYGGFDWTCGIRASDDTPVPLLQRCEQHVPRHVVDGKEDLALHMVGMEGVEIEDWTWRWCRDDDAIVVDSSGEDDNEEEDGIGEKDNGGEDDSGVNGMSDFVVAMDQAVG